ncbi:ABC transporter family G domain [Dillenia turbinata]|uniref:ABC transporter family G domain n=1 Tax=Dillenia turbinata TaxID=194707 RepID=A0AAN8ZJM4_9MAGN
MNIFRANVIIVFGLTLVLSSALEIRCLTEDESSRTGNPAVLPEVTKLIYSHLTNLTRAFTSEVNNDLGFCVKDIQEDWQNAFKFENDLSYVSNCVKNTEGDITQRICTAAEIRFYFESFFGKTQTRTNYLKPNMNCNLTYWVSGCEPGWNCATSTKEKVDLRSKVIPRRTQDCKPCCEGFFCPQGLTCMFPCPLGSYCPLAKLNKTTGVCEPYHYQLPPGKKDHTCGGADVWADVESSIEIFCSGGSYCPSTIQKNSCHTGHYCRMGSTAEESCFKMTTCEAGTANQNIHAYGISLVVALSSVLLIIYNCSDQVLTTRERRQAKSRERAVRSAQETAQARERWKSAKDVAKKRAIGLQTQLSRTFSRKKSVKHSEPLKVLGQATPDANDASLPLPPGTSQQSSGASQGKKKDPSNLTKMLRKLEENPESNEGFHLEIGDKNLKKTTPKAKQLHTKSQIYKYAYGQLEKEKAMQEKNQNLTFSGIINMATNDETRTRPPLEISFKDLTLTLKGTNKHLLRCVSGKISPGRVSAVMGPSGAGKTTFLSALAGKISGCTRTGLILINGKNESIHSYKKIIGFVPQDDIVHGNLTVEENLRFSARCRLSAEMPKPDKVLVVERVIECLGLQNVRDSLVGTVEKRGISGGQRKRVNVGLEMVMEPSLLILDEPTTGLDSASSQLLLRALRREALEGVNISMVLHQPSYALFKMFDDLILLAKGGLTVYHGSAKKVEEYFTGIGITVPERVNPPDHYIDILEGMVKPSSGATREQLPIRWMLHNSYAIPPDMLHLADGLSSSSPSANASSADGNADGALEQSFAGDLLQDMKYNVEMQRDNLAHNFLKSQDLSNRTTPGILRQYRYFLGRVGKQQLREAKVQVADYLILLLAGACLGTLAKVSDETFGSLALLSKIGALRSFSLDKLHYQRESASGISSLAYFMSKDTIDHFNTIVKPLVYLSMFYFFNVPRSSFLSNYIILVCLVYCVTGMAYGFAIFFEPSPAQLWSVLVPVVMTLIASQEQDGGFINQIAKFCYTKWALEAFVIANAEKYSGVWLITRCGSLMQRGYNIRHGLHCLIILIGTGVLCRIIAFLFMVTFQKK